MEIDPLYDGITPLVRREAYNNGGYLEIDAENDSVTVFDTAGKVIDIYYITDMVENAIEEATELRKKEIRRTARGSNEDAKTPPCVVSSLVE